MTFDSEFWEDFNQSIEDENLEISLRRDHDMTLTQEDIRQRESELVSFSQVGGIPFILHRFQPPNDWNTNWYGVPEQRIEGRERKFLIHPKGMMALERFVELLKNIGYAKHTKSILTGGTKVERNQRGIDRPSPHSILKGSKDEDIFCTAIDIGAFTWCHTPPDGPVTSYTAKRTLSPKTVGLRDGSTIDVVGAYDKPYVVVLCILSQCFGTVLHDKCSGKTGIDHGDHFHVDLTRPVKYRKSNSQNTAIQMALNLSSWTGEELVIDGRIGPKTLEVWQRWTRRNDLQWTHERAMWKELMKFVPIQHGMIR